MMIQNLIIRVLIIAVVIGAIATSGYLKYENTQLRGELEKCKQTQSDLIALCEKNLETENKITQALKFSKEPATIESFKSIVDILFEGKK